MTQHAVLIDGRLITLKEVVRCVTPKNFPEIFDLVHKRGITHVWVNMGFEYAPWTSEGEWSFKNNIDKHGKLKTVSIWKRGAGHVTVIFPKHTAWYGTEKQPGWIRGATPREVLETIQILEEKLGVVVAGSPATVGWRLLKKLHPEWIGKMDVDLRELHFTPKAGHDLIWTGPFGKGRYAHKFDKGAAYSAAGASTDIGGGTPIHVDHGRDAVHEKGHPQAVGVWRCTVKYGPTDPSMPPVWKEEKGSYAATEGWLAGPIIRLLRSQGHDVQVHEGNVFPERHDVLAAWAVFLFKRRQELASTPRAQRAIKQIANSTIGFTAFKGFEDDEEEKRRPDIRLQVVSRLREIMWHNINKVRQLYGKVPFMVYMDAVYYLSDERDGRKAFPELVKREGLLGGFRWEGCIEVTDEVRATLTGKGNEAMKLEILNAKGWTK